jgi:hypothetical protein
MDGEHETGVKPDRQGTTARGPFQGGAATVTMTATGRLLCKARWWRYPHGRRQACRVFLIEAQLLAVAEARACSCPSRMSAVPHAWDNGL